MQRQKAFTILELITVVMVVLIFASLVFPVYGKVRKSAYLTQDVMQMRQVYLATALYEEDSNDYLPQSLLFTEPYAKSTEVYVSPVDPYRNGIPGVPDFPANMDDGLGVRSPFRISYAYFGSMAIDHGFSDAAIREVEEDPGYGLISMTMYNEPYKDQTRDPSQVDYWRYQLTDHRILMDGSYMTAHGQSGVSYTCDMLFCFGAIPPPYNIPGTEG